jgi:hypothetical protein
MTIRMVASHESPPMKDLILILVAMHEKDPPAGAIHKLLTPISEAARAMRKPVPHPGIQA